MKIISKKGRCIYNILTMGVFMAAIEGQPYAHPIDAICEEGSSSPRQAIFSFQTILPPALAEEVEEKAGKAEDIKENAISLMGERGSIWPQTNQQLPTINEDEDTKAESSSHASEGLRNVRNQLLSDWKAISMRSDLTPTQKVEALLKKYNYLRDHYNELLSEEANLAQHFLWPMGNVVRCVGDMGRRSGYWIFKTIESVADLHPLKWFGKKLGLTSMNEETLAERENQLVVYVVNKLIRANNKVWNGMRWVGGTMRPETPTLARMVLHIEKYFPLRDRDEFFELVKGVLEQDAAGSKDIVEERAPDAIMKKVKATLIYR
jgi:hypothetical protein